MTKGDYAALMTGAGVLVGFVAGLLLFELGGLPAWLVGTLALAVAWGSLSGLGGHLGDRRGWWE